MKKLYLLWAIFLAGTFYIMFQMLAINEDLATQTNPAFDIIKFEIPPDLKYSKVLFESIRKNDLTSQVQATIDWDYWYIPFYVGATILGWILLLKIFEVEKKWLFEVIALLAVLAGVFDFVENKNLENLLTEWNIPMVERAAFFAKIKFGIILPLLGSVLLGWVYFLGKKLLGTFQKIGD